MSKVVGLLVGRENTFPGPFIETVNRKGEPHGVTAELAVLGGTRELEVPRAHATSPARHSPSRSAGVYPAMRADKTSRSQARAGSSTPSSCVVTARSPSGPASALEGSTCCHAKRYRMNSAGVTGEISARSRLSV